MPLSAMYEKSTVTATVTALINSRERRGRRGDSRRARTCSDALKRSSVCPLARTAASCPNLGASSGRRSVGADRRTFVLHARRANPAHAPGGPLGGRVEGPIAGAIGRDRLQCAVAVRALLLHEHRHFRRAGARPHEPPQRKAVPVL